MHTRTQPRRRSTLWIACWTLVALVGTALVAQAQFSPSSQGAPLRFGLNGPSRKLRVTIEGWRGLSHSYAVVCQFVTLALLDHPHIEQVSFIDTKLYRDEWTRKSGLFPPEMQARIDALKPPQQPADVVMRFSFPMNLEPDPSGAVTLVFGTTEFQAMLDVMRVPSAYHWHNTSVHVITPSRWSREGFLYAGMPSSQIHVIPHGVDSQLFHTVAPDVRESLRTARGWQDRFVIMSIGGMTGNKGIPDLITAFTALLESWKEGNAGRLRPLLFLKGADDLYQSRRLVQLPRHLVASGDIVYDGQTLPFSQMAQLLQAADLYVSPYRAEGFNLPVLEAIACGVPVAVTAGGSTDDFVHNCCGWKIPSTLSTAMYGDVAGVNVMPNVTGLIKGLQITTVDKAWMDVARFMGPQYAIAHYTWHAVVRRTLAVVADIVSGPGFPRPEELSDAADASTSAAEFHQPDLAAQLWRRHCSNQSVSQDACMLRAVHMLQPIAPMGMDAVSGVSRVMSVLAEGEPAAPDVDPQDVLRPLSGGFLPYPNVYLMYTPMMNVLYVKEAAVGYTRLFPSVRYSIPRRSASHRVGTVTRVGFLSSNLYNHSTGKALAGVIVGLARRPQFEVHVFWVPPVSPSQDLATDVVMQYVRSNAVHWHDFGLPATRHIATRQMELNAANLDVLIFADSGMHVPTYTLALGRYAPVQCAFWAFPHTLGSEAVDYFLVGQDFVGPALNTQDYFFEQVVQLAGVGAFLFPIQFPPQPAGLEARRAQLSVLLPRIDVDIVLCPQSLVKLSPEFLVVVRRILETHPLAIFVVLEGVARHWVPFFEARAAELGLPMHRVWVLPRLDAAAYAMLLSAATVILDTFPYSGFTTNMEALAMGAPVVTLQTDHIRGTQTCALYRRMGFTELVATTPAEYEHITMQLLLHPEYRRHVVTEISAKVPSIFLDESVVEDWAKFLARVAVS